MDSTVAQLLAQLQAHLNQPAPTPVPIPEPQPPQPHSFQSALPKIAEMAQDQEFVSLVQSLQQEQLTLEKQLWQERCAIQARYDDKVKVAVTKAKMTAGSISKHEAMMLSDALSKEMRKFDRERALPAWDGLLARQQTALHSRGVPFMSVTSNPDTRQLQQRVIQVLQSLVEDTPTSTGN